MPEKARPPHVLSPRHVKFIHRLPDFFDLQIIYHNDMKFLISKHVIFGAMHMHTPHELAFRGSTVQAASTYLRPGSKSAISLGVGTGAVVKELRHRNLQVRAVELDPKVARLARIEFGVGCSVGDGSFTAFVD